MKKVDEKSLSGTGRNRRDAFKAIGAGLLGAAALVAAPDEAHAREKKRDRKGRKGQTPRWGMVIDIRRCIGCRGCTVSCKAEFDVPLGNFNCVVHQVEVGKYPNAKKVFLPVLCNHCSGKDGKPPPCVQECPNKSMKRATYYAPDGSKTRYKIGATYQRPDGAILLDTEFCTGCGKCIEACPYGVRWFHPSVKAPLDPSKQAVGKCNLCMHRVDKGLLPACVNTCQGKARIFGDLNDPSSEISKLVKEFKLDENRDRTTLLPEEETGPNVFYIDPDNVIGQINTKEKEFKDEVF